MQEKGAQKRSSEKRRPIKWCLKKICIKMDSSKTCRVFKNGNTTKKCHLKRRQKKGVLKFIQYHISNILLHTHTHTLLHIGIH